ncbi:probable acyl-[acyl-carrier-protein]--UDP-N-acetylglucosamine O-acyltransferase, mitochondrial isoform X1 [Tanacetum coccineum]
MNASHSLCSTFILNVYAIDFIHMQGISVGPFCTVGPSAVLGNNCKRHLGSHVCGNTELGDKCILISGAIVRDNLPEKTIIRCNNVIGHHAVVGIKCQDMKYKCVRLQVMNAFLKVGDIYEIRESVSIQQIFKTLTMQLNAGSSLVSSVLQYRVSSV